MQVPEIEVVRLWQEQLTRRRCLVDSAGQPVNVVYPGRPNDTRGGDFRDALVTISRESKSGCIEIHTLASHWQSHGHHLDPFYNQVVLHVALEGDRDFITRLQNGSSVPTIILDNQVTPQNPDSPSELARRCHGQDGNQYRLEILERAGSERFDSRVKRLAEELASQDAEQVLYQNILEALGYTRNKIPFRHLAGQAPLKRLTDLASTDNSASERLIRWQAVLWGLAGLLPSQRNLIIPEEEYTDRLENIWSAFPSGSSFLSVWELFKVRPENYPVRRIAAVSYLLLRYREKGWVRNFQGLVRLTPASRAHQKLESALMITAEGYWTNHYDFGSLHAVNSQVLLGRERAAEIVVNVVLPFFSAWSQITGEPELASAAREIFHCYPRLAENSLERHMLHQMGLDRRMVNSARRQQGLIQLYKTRCTQGKCAECELGP
jgi:hypothetical protein